MTRYVRHNSIRARITLTFSGAIAILMACVCSGIIWYAHHVAVTDADSLLRNVADRVQGDLTLDGRRRTPTELMVEERDDLLPGLSLIIVDQKGRIIQQMPRNTLSWPPGGDWRTVIVPFDSNIVVIGLPWRETENGLRAQAVGLSLLGIFVVAVSAAGAWWVVGRTLSPIGRLSRQARAASADDLSAHLDLPSEDAEIMELVTTLNGLLTRQAEAARVRSQFHAAASHELRTPLQALSGHLELALQRPRTVDEYHAAVKEAYRQTCRLTALTRDLLLLNRLRSSPLGAREQVDLSAVCEAALCAYASLEQSRDLQITTDLPADVLVKAAPTHAEMLARNLVENAVKYASPGGEVRASVRSIPEGSELEVFNTCPPLPEWNPEKLCEPFYRPDASRNSQTGGTGLGLAICKAICDVNGWQLALYQREDGVLSRVTFAEAAVG
jgi:signal transduction histidine kinase